MQRGLTACARYQTATPLHQRAATQRISHPFCKLLTVYDIRGAQERVWRFSRRADAASNAHLQSDPDGWKGRAAWATLCVTVFIYMSGASMLSPILPSIVLKYGVGTGEMGKLLSSFALAMCAISEG
jgi:hypothetical protein